MMRRKVLVCCILFAACTKSEAVNFLRAFVDNFHTVYPGEMYRAQQLGPRRLRYYLTKFNIKTVINLRGSHPRHAWWYHEREVCKEFGVQHYDVRLSGTYQSSAQEIALLLALYDMVDTPILIHCQGGADRTGEAAGLWHWHQGRDLSHALNELTLKQRHFRCVYPKKIPFIIAWYQKQWSSFEKVSQQLYSAQGDVGMSSDEHKFEGRKGLYAVYLSCDRVLGAVRNGGTRCSSVC
jgi:protein tyrosine/serine phosphatase